MKTLILLAALTAADHEICTSISNHAGQIMTARQNGVPMSKLIEVVNGDEMSIGMIRFSYSVPLYAGKKNKQREINKFRDEEHARCLYIRDKD